MTLVCELEVPDAGEEIFFFIDDVFTSYFKFKKRRVTVAEGKVQKKN